MIKTLLMILFLILVGVVSLVLIPFAFLLGLFSKEKRLAFSFTFVRFCMRILRAISGADVTYKGLEIARSQNEPVVYVGNHRGLFDIILTYSVFEHPTGFVAKKEMKTWPVVGWWMWLVNCPFIDRKNVKEGIKAILQAIKNIEAGTSMVIFPEGTRSRIEGEILNFKAGSFKMALKPKAKIIPIACNNTSMLFEDHTPFIKKAKVCIEFCEPVSTEGLTPEEEKALPDHIRSIIYEKVQSNGKEIGSIK